MIDYHNGAWNCPRCKKWNRVKGMGKKIRKCRCGYKIMIETTYVKAWHLVSNIINIKEIKNG